MNATELQSLGFEGLFSLYQDRIDRLVAYESGKFDGFMSSHDDVKAAAYDKMLSTYNALKSRDGSHNVWTFFHVSLKRKLLRLREMTTRHPVAAEGVDSNVVLLSEQPNPEETAQVRADTVVDVVEVRHAFRKAYPELRYLVEELLFPDSPHVPILFEFTGHIQGKILEIPYFLPRSCVDNIDDIVDEVFDGRGFEYVEYDYAEPRLDLMRRCHGDPERLACYRLGYNSQRAGTLVRDFKGTIAYLKSVRELPSRYFDHIESL